MPIRLSGLVSNMDTDAIIKELMSAQSMKKTKIENKKTKLEWKKEKWQSLNAKIYKLYTGTLSKMRFQSNYATKNASSTNETALMATATSTAANGAHQISISKLASSQYITSGVVKKDGETTSTVTATTTLDDLLSGTVTGGTTIDVTTKDSNGNNVVKTLNVDSTTTVQEFINKCKEAGLNASFDDNQKRFYISSKNSGEKNAFTISSSDTTLLQNMGLGSAATTIAAQDAEFKLDNVDYKMDSNTVTVNGLNLVLKETSATPITLTVTNDTDAAYKMIKDFLTEYNELLEEMNDDYYAGTAKGYEPLTSEQKEAMSDDEVEKWETKIKDSLLRRDDKLGGLLSSMKSILTGPIEGSTESLSTFGITSALYTEKGKLHIDGDPEDALVADQKDKLKKALEEDPNKVMGVLTTVCGKLYGEMQKKMSSSTLNSALTFYNDKEINKRIDDYEEEIDRMEDRLKDIEDRYYKQFTAMETMMSKMNSQQNALASFIG